MMNGMNFTARLQAVLARARDESIRLGHEYIGTEHILLALLGEEQGIPPSVLRHSGIEPQQIRQQIEEIVRPGSRDNMTSPDLPFTSRGKRVLDLALAEALRTRAGAIDTEHLLLGLCLEGKGIAAQVLAEAGLTTDVARRESERG